MTTSRHPLDRRRFLVSASALLSSANGKTAVAALVTEYRYYSHADVIVGRMLEGYVPDGTHVKPRTKIVSMFTDQVPSNDMSRGLAGRYGFRIFPSVREALTLGGGRLAVDAVLLVGEHGNYPTNDRGQKLYPRYELFSQVVEVFRDSRRSVPVFCDKHLSIPVTIRRPPLEIPGIPRGSRTRD